MLGSVDSIAGRPATTSRRSSPSGTVRANLVVTAAGLVDHDELVEQVVARLVVHPVSDRSAACRRCPPSRWWWHTTRESWSSSPGVGVPAGARRRPLRVGGAQPHPGRRPLQPSVPTGEGGPRPDLLDLVGGLAVHRCRRASVACSTTPGKAAHLIELVHAEVDGLARRGITADELARAARSMRGSPPAWASRTSAPEGPGWGCPRPFAARSRRCRSTWRGSTRSTSNRSHGSPSPCWRSPGALDGGARRTGVAGRLSAERAGGQSIAVSACSTSSWVTPSTNRIASR